MSELAKTIQLQIISKAEPWKIGKLEPGMKVLLPGAPAAGTDPEIETGNGECGLIALHQALKCQGSDVTLPALFAAAPELRSGAADIGLLALPLAKTAGLDYSLDTHQQTELRAATAEEGWVLSIVDELLKGNSCLIWINQLDKYLHLGPNHPHAIAIGGFEINGRGVPIFLTFDPAIASDGPVPVSARHLLKNSDPQFFVLSKQPGQETVTA